jgi:phosphatidylinositol-3-phosphatase
MTPSRLLVAATLVAAAIAVPSPARAQNGMCGFLSHHPQHYAHVVWIWLENHSAGQIIGSPDAPYINGVADACGLATNFHNITHVSLPNYIGAVTGLALPDLLAFQFDCSPSSTCSTAAASIFGQVPSWKAYMESMTTNCESTGLVGYAVRHNPPPYLTTLSNCSTFDVPYTALQVDLDADTLPAFSFVTPDTVNDMHDGPDPNAIQNGDNWLAAELPKIVNSAAYQSGQTAIFITWDEGEGAGFSIGEDCAKNTTDESCHVATIVLTPSTTPGTRSGKLFNHYSMLRTTEQLLGVRPKLGLARRARSMRRAFRM